MMTICYFDWFGTPEELEKYISAVKKAFDKTPGTKYLGRYGAVNKKYHYAFFAEVKDWITYQEANKNFDYKRDYTKLPHLEWEFFS